MAARAGRAVRAAHAADRGFVVFYRWPCRIRAVLLSARNQVGAYAAGTMAKAYGVGTIRIAGLRLHYPVRRPVPADVESIQHCDALEIHVWIFGNRSADRRLFLCWSDRFSFCHGLVLPATSFWR